MDRLSPQQHADLLGELATQALHIAHLAERTINSSGDVQAIESLSVAIGVMARRLGWLAESAAERLGHPVGICGSGADDWMSPLSH